MIGIVLVVVLGAVGYQAWRSSRSPQAPLPQPTFGPVDIVDGKPIVLGEDDAEVTITLYEDFRCPHCADFEEQLGPTIAALQRDGTVKVALYPMSFVDPKGGSVSAANAMACAASAGRGQQYYAGLFGNDGLEWTDERLIELGGLVGLKSATFDTCVRSDRHREWVESITRVAAQHSVEETPTVLIDDQIQADAVSWKPEQLRSAVEAAH